MMSAANPRKSRKKQAPGTGTRMSDDAGGTMTVPTWSRASGDKGEPEGRSPSAGVKKQKIN